MSDESAHSSDDTERSATFKAPFAIAELATQLGYNADEYEIAGVEYEGDDEIRVKFRSLDAGTD